MALRILDVGQCGFDGPRMATLWHEKLDAKVDRSPGLADAEKKLKLNQYNIILVNRVLAADGSSGIEVIEALLKETKTPVMLVSDHLEAQDEAVALGAVRGFGKAHLGEPETLELVRQAASV